MPCEFEQTLFLGASIRNVNCNVGFNQQQSTLEVNLVEDLRPGDEDNPKVEYRCGFREETIAPDYFFPKDYSDKLIGHPAFFKLGEFEFGGLIQNWEKTESTDGKPLYSVNLIDPRDILAGTTVITGGYSGDVQGVPNLLNVFAHMEGYGQDCPHTDSGGFGGAYVNEGGMPWNKIKQGLEEVTAIGFSSDYGQPLQFKGHTYFIDIGELPVVDDYVRVSGNTHTLLDLIDFICSSTNHDYFIELFFDNPTDDDCSATNKYIKVNVIPRTLAPVLGKITQFIDNETAAGRRVISTNAGFELRIEPTTGFLVGGNKTAMFPITYNDKDENDEEIPDGQEYKYNIWPYWGDKVNSNSEAPEPIMGRLKGDRHHIDIDITGLNIGLEQFNVNGRIIYTMTVKEMRHLLTSMDAWLTFMAMYRSSVVLAVETGSLCGAKKLENKLNITGTTKPMLAMTDLVNTVAADLVRRSNAKIGFEGQELKSLYKSQILYEFLYNYIQTYYNKQFMVSLPEICSYKEAETGRIVNNVEPVSSGWQELDESLLGLLTKDMLLFRAEDGTLQSFVKYTIPHNVPFDPDRENEFFLDSEDAIIYKTTGGNGSISTTVYIPCEVDPKIRFVFPQNVGTENRAYPKVIIKIGGRVTQTGGRTEHMGAITQAIIKARNDVADATEIWDETWFGEDWEDDVAAWDELQKAEQMLKKATQNGGLGDYEIARSDAGIIPNAVALPLRSLVDTYGPWVSTAGPTGPVNFEQNPDLVPWNYGSQDNLDTVANILVSGGLSNTQVLESGTLTVVSLPQVNIGRELLSYGPIVTGISINIGTEGITTTYRMKTYTNKYGVLSKANADRFRRLGDRNNRIVRDFNNKIRTNVKGPNQLRGFGGASKATKTDLMFGSDKRRMGISSKSPIPMLYASTDSYVNPNTGGKWDTDTSSPITNQYTRHNVDMRSLGEFLANINEEDWSRKAFISLDGIFTPFVYGFRVAASADSRTSLSLATTESNSYETGSEFALNTLPALPPSNINHAVEIPKYIDATTLNPTRSFQTGQWRPNNSSITQDNIHLISSGETAMPDDISTRFGTREAYVKSLALRGPVMICGWGWDVHNKPVPNHLEDNHGRAKTAYFANGFMSKPYMWKCGPLDVRWDSRRGVWTSWPGYSWLTVSIDEGQDLSGIPGSVQTTVLKGANFTPDEDEYRDISETDPAIEAGTVISPSDRKIQAYNPFGYKLYEGQNYVVVYDYIQQQYVIMFGRLKELEVVTDVNFGTSTTTKKKIYVIGYKDVP
jgi:hypothetical protein